MNNKRGKGLESISTTSGKGFFLRISSASIDNTNCQFLEHLCVFIALFATFRLLQIFQGKRSTTYVSKQIPKIYKLNLNVNHNWEKSWHFLSLQCFFPVARHLSLAIKLAFLIKSYWNPVASFLNNSCLFWQQTEPNFFCGVVSSKYIFAQT